MCHEVKDARNKNPMINIPIYHSVKLTASIRCLMPNLQECDRSVVSMKAAVSEMVTIASHLSTHEDARDGEGIRREEGDVGEYREEEGN
jgi:hypothetical protein